MTALTPTPVRETVDLLIRDLRHTAARAAPDLADWLVHLELEGKADRTIYAYHRQVAPLLRANPDTPLEGFTHTDINNELRLIPQRSRHITRSIYNQLFASATRTCWRSAAITARTRTRSCSVIA